MVDTNDMFDRMHVGYAAKVAQISIKQDYRIYSVDYCQSFIGRNMSN